MCTRGIDEYNQVNLTAVARSTASYSNILTKQTVNHSVRLTKTTKVMQKKNSVEYL